MDQADEDVRDYLGGARLDIGRIGLIGPIFLAAQASQEPRLPAVLVPESRFPHSQKITIVFQQFLQAGARHIYQFDLGFLRSSGGLAPFEDVLLPGARRLHHLIHGPVALVKKPFAKPHRGVRHNPRFLKRKELFITAMWRNKVLGHGRQVYRSHETYTTY